VGHYFSHVFLGDDGFEQLSTQLRAIHEFGDPHAERPMLEEYAMLVDFFKNGSINGRLDPEEPVTELRRNHGNDKPSNVDWPSKEGYPTCLLARLRATGGTIAGFSSVAEEIPVIGTSFAEIFAMLYTRRPSTASELRLAIAEKLQQRGVADRLPPLLERTGWSYHGHGTIKDPQGRAVGGAWVQSLCRVASEGGRVYHAPLVPVQTKADGSFELSRLFPGESILQVTVEDRRYEFPITVDPVPSTVVAVPLGDFTVTASLLDDLKQLPWVYLRCNGEFDLDNGGMEVTLFGVGNYFREHPVTWEGNKLTWDFADSTSFGGAVNGMTMHCEATFAADGHSIQSLTAHQYEWESFQGTLTHTRISDIDVADLAEDWIDLGTPGSKFAYFNRLGPDIGPRVRSISFVERYHSDAQVVTITATGFRWTGTQMPGWVELKLQDSNQ
ncbi:MAG: hypothetical protein FJ313_08720, partial [Gemmatimonadetes bacterium]|nr:hypothetical protein [Gemmatimonadota bacterium]